MYYVNREQIECRLDYLSIVVEALHQLGKEISIGNLVHQLALERAIHVAAECVTDIGSYMIDGFVMRDAASYEDIVEILHSENVISIELFQLLSPLVKMRKPLVQNYFDIEKKDLRSLSIKLPEGLECFAGAIRQYLTKESGFIYTK
jgi:uncharacterized protein YutE (UPF0331/DUF86 family)